MKTKSIKGKSNLGCFPLPNCRSCTRLAPEHEDPKSELPHAHFSRLDHAAQEKRAAQRNATACVRCGHLRHRGVPPRGVFDYGNDNTSGTVECRRAEFSITATTSIPVPVIRGMKNITRYRRLTN